MWLFFMYLQVQDSPYSVLVPRTSRVTNPASYVAGPFVKNPFQKNLFSV